LPSGLLLKFGGPIKKNETRFHEFSFYLVTFKVDLPLLVNKITGDLPFSMISSE
jgi:hypothetical protein